MNENTPKQSLWDNVKAPDTWTRLVFMMLFLVIYGIAEIVLTAMVAFQVGSALLVRRPNERLLGLGRQISAFMYGILLFLTYNTEEKPYPFGDWPAPEPGGGNASP